MPARPSDEGPARVLVVGVASPAGVAAATRFALGGAALTVIDEDLSAADRFVEALRAQGCSARVEAATPTDSNAIVALVSDHQIIIDTATDATYGGRVPEFAAASHVAYLRARPSNATAARSSAHGFRAFVDLTFTPDGAEELDVLVPLMDALGRAMTDGRFAGHISVHASPDG